LLTAKTNLKGKFKILITNILTILMLMILSTLVDSIYHGKLTSTFYNFLEFNLLSGMSSFYGVHDRTWFLTQGLPYV
jgi:phosphatidylinositol glycan class B